MTLTHCAAGAGEVLVELQLGFGGPPAAPPVAVVPPEPPLDIAPPVAGDPPVVDEVPPLDDALEPPVLVAVFPPELGPPPEPELSLPLAPPLLFVELDELHAGTKTANASHPTSRMVCPFAGHFD